MKGKRQYARYVEYLLFVPLIQSIPIWTALCWESDLNAPHPPKLPVLWLLVGVGLRESWREGDWKEEMGE